MGLWLVRDVPSWLLAVTVIGGLPITLVVCDHLLHWRLPHRRLGRHNVVTGIFVSVVGVAYGIMAGHCVVTLWDAYTEAATLARQESANLTALAETSHVFGTEVEAQLSARVADYNTGIVDGWDERIEGQASPQEDGKLDELADTIAALSPANAAQEAFVSDAVARIGLARQYRQYALDQASDQRIPGMLWFAFAAATVGVLASCLLFGLDDATLRRSLLGVAAIVVATNLFVVVEMNYPYYGSFSVGSDSYQQAADALRQ